MVASKSRKHEWIELSNTWYKYYLVIVNKQIFSQSIVWIQRNLSLFVCLFCRFTSQVNSYGHSGTVSSPSHTFSWASLNKQLTSTSCTYFLLQLTTTLLEWFSGREENDRRNYFMINLLESMEPGRDRTREPWICSHTRICCQVTDCATRPSGTCLKQPLKNRQDEGLKDKW